MLVEVNGESRDVPASITLAEFVARLALAPERLAIELNRQVVRRTHWSEIILHEGDRLEIVHFVGGGVEEQ